MKMGEKRAMMRYGGTKGKNYRYKPNKLGEFLINVLNDNNKDIIKELALKLESEGFIQMGTLDIIFSKARAMWEDIIRERSSKHAGSKNG